MSLVAARIEDESTASPIFSSESQFPYDERLMIEAKNLVDHKRVC